MDVITLSAHQPCPLPSVQYFNKIMRSDIFIVRDDVFLSRGDWQKRFSIRDKVNGKHVISVPVSSTTSGLRLKDIKIHGFEAFSAKILRIIHDRYKKSPYFDELFPEVQHIIRSASGFLIELCVPFILFLCRRLNINTTVCSASSFMLPEGKNEALIELCRIFRAAKYLTGAGGLNYLRRELWEAENIHVDLIKWKPAEYRQLGNAAFSPNLSMLDLVFMTDKDALLYICDTEYD